MDATCSNCDSFRPRGFVHRCAAPNLVPLSAAAWKVLDAIVAVGGRPLVVGGSVRDAFLDQPIKDVDIEVFGLTDSVALVTALRRVAHVDEYGESFAVIAVKLDGEDFDVSFPRTDSKTGPRHTDFEVTVDGNLDEVTAFGRRDFTVNALGWDPVTEELVDPWGGLADLDAGVLRHTTSAFAEDPLRVLRGVQFSGRFGFRLAPDTADLARSISDGFHELPLSRVWGEWHKLAQRAVNWPAALAALRATGWDEHFPELAATFGVQQDPAWHSEGDVWTHSGLAANVAAASGTTGVERDVAVFGALLHDLGKVTHTQHEDDGRIRSRGHDDAGAAPATSFLRRIGAPQLLVDRVVPIVREHMCHVSVKPTPSIVRRLIRRLNPDGRGPSIWDWARVVDADCAGRGASSKASPTADWLAVAERLGSPVVPRGALLSGSYLISLGLTPGPTFAPIIAASIVAQDDGLFDDAAGANVWFDENYTSLLDRA